MIQQNQQNQHSMPTSFVVVRALFSISIGIEFDGWYCLSCLETDASASMGGLRATIKGSWYKHVSHGTDTRFSSPLFSSFLILNISSNYGPFFLCGYGPVWPVSGANCLLDSRMDPCRLRLGQSARQRHSPQWPLDVQTRGPWINRSLGSICKPSNYHRCSWESTNWCSCGPWICMESRKCCCIRIIIEEHCQFLQADSKWRCWH